LPTPERASFTFDEHPEEGGDVEEPEEDEEGAPEAVGVSVLPDGLRRHTVDHNHPPPRFPLSLS